VNAAKVKVTLGRYVGDVGGDPSLLAQLPDDSRCGGIVDGYQHHLGSIEVLGFEQAVDMCDLALADSVGDFVVEAGLGANDNYLCIGIEAVEDATGGDLVEKSQVRDGTNKVSQQKNMCHVVWANMCNQCLRDARPSR
jgi:hypothetical protein